jgi:glucosyl-dolichyl phosphate glucuronosyltransferase
VEPDWLRALCSPFEADTAHQIGAVGGEVIPVFPEGVPAWVAAWHAPLGFRPDAGPLSPGQSPMGANLAFRREVFAQIGYFTPHLGRMGKSLFGGEETEKLRQLRAAGLEVWFAPAARVRHQMPASRTTFRYTARHAFDSARSRVLDRVSQGQSAGFLASRLAGNLAKAGGFVLLALLNLVVLRSGAAKQSLVRAWRSCGYLYQIVRSAVGAR